MNSTKAMYRDIGLKAAEIIRGAGRAETRMKQVCELLAENIPHYDWVGFYLVGDKADELVLGPFVGSPTEHVLIPFGKGICGQAAEMEKTVIIQDVSLETNYLSCAPDVRSEIVVPIFRNGSVAGELDIDSHEISPFTWRDKVLLEEICRQIADIL